MAPSKEKPTSRTTAAEAENAWRRKKPSGSIGSALRRSQAMNRPSTTAAAIIPMGTFTQKTADHEKRSTRNPPASGPTARPRLEIPAQMPMAVGTCLRANAATRMASESGLSSAPPAPCTTREAMSWWSLVATALALGHSPGDRAAWAAADPLLLAGLGRGMVTSPNVTLTLAAVPVPMAGAAGGALQTAQRIGSAIGTAPAGLGLLPVLTASGHDYPKAVSDACCAPAR